MTAAAAEKVNVFLAHPIGLDDVQLADLKAAVTAACAQDVEQPVDVVLGRDDFAQQFAARGGWDGWISSVAEGTVTTFAGTKPRYSGIIVSPSRQVGKATAQIIKLAMAAGKLVLFFDQSAHTLRQIVGVVWTDPTDYRAGWTVDIR